MTARCGSACAPRPRRAPAPPRRPLCRARPGSRRRRDPRGAGERARAQASRDRCTSLPGRSRRARPRRPSAAPASCAPIRPTACVWRITNGHAPCIASSARCCASASRAGMPRCSPAPPELGPRARSARPPHAHGLERRPSSAACCASQVDSRQRARTGDAGPRASTRHCATRPGRRCSPTASPRTSSTCALGRSARASPAIASTTPTCPSTPSRSTLYTARSSRQRTVAVRAGIRRAGRDRARSACAGAAPKCWPALPEATGVPAERIRVRTRAAHNARRAVPESGRAGAVSTA